MIKVVSAQEMVRIEKLAYAKGASEELFMDSAGLAIAKLCPLAENYTLLVGKGNNGGDAYVAGAHLLKKGVSVRAIHIFPLDSCSPLCRKKYEEFKEAGGAVTFADTPEKISFGSTGWILDGLTGTGFQGNAEKILAAAIDKANHSKLPILAIDIPSGLNGTTGEVGTIAIKATKTAYLGLPKIGFFIGQGWDYVGELIGADFGLTAPFIEEAEPEALLVEGEDLSLPSIKRSRHKYEAGYVLGIGGSPSMPGAAALSSLAALRAGAGIVRLFHSPGMEKCSLPPEVIHEELHIDRILEESKRASALFVGPGLGRTADVKKFLSKLLPLLTLPTVLDADALFFLADSPGCTLPRDSILTPHRREMERLLDKTPTLPACQAYVDAHNITVILKGGPTFIFAPRSKPYLIIRGDPGMAKAGTGDVLTGILAALLAQKMDPLHAALLGVFLHDLAGEIASREKTPYGLIASDLIEYLPKAFNVL